MVGHVFIPLPVCLKPAWATQRGHACLKSRKPELETRQPLTDVASFRRWQEEVARVFGANAMFFSNVCSIVPELQVYHRAINSSCEQTGCRAALPHAALLSAESITFQCLSFYEPAHRPSHPSVSRKKTSRLGSCILYSFDKYRKICSHLSKLYLPKCSKGIYLKSCIHSLLCTK